MICKLCDKAFKTAQFLTTTILKYSNVNSTSENRIENVQQKIDNIIQTTKHKKKSSKNLFYQFLKFIKIKMKINSADKFNSFEEKSKSDFNDLSWNCVSDSIQNKNIISQNCNVEISKVLLSENISKIMLNRKMTEIIQEIETVLAVNKVKK